MSLKYAIGDVSRVLGMTTSALHYYEKEGLLSVEKRESGYRYYNEADVYRLISAKKYRAMGVSLKEIVQQFCDDGMNAQQVIDRMRGKQAEAERLSAGYAALAADIERLIALGEEGLDALCRPDIRYMSGMIAFKTQNGGLIPRAREGQQIVQQWIEALPAVAVSILSWNAEDPAGLALMIPQNRARDYGFTSDGKFVREVPQGMAIHAIVTCGEEQYENPEMIFQPVKNFAREHHFERSGAMFGNVLFVDCSDCTRKYYYDTYMMIDL